MYDILYPRHWYADCLVRKSRDCVYLTVQILLYVYKSYYCLSKCVRSPVLCLRLTLLVAIHYAQSCENKNVDIKLFQSLSTVTSVAVMVQDHPYWLNEKYGKSSWRKLRFFCHQNVNHEMLYKSQHCLSDVEKWKKDPKCTEMKAMLIIKGPVLHAIDVNEHTLQMSFLNKIIFIHQLHTSQRAFSSQVNRKYGQPEISVHPNNWKTAITNNSSLLIDTGFDWNLSSFPSAIWYINTCLRGAVMVWRREKYLPSSRSLVTYTLSVWVPLWWVRVMTIFCRWWQWWSGCILQQNIYFHSSTDLFPFAMLIIFSCLPNLDV